MRSCVWCFLFMFTCEFSSGITMVLLTYFTPNKVPYLWNQQNEIFIETESMLHKSYLSRIVNLCFLVYIEFSTDIATKCNNFINITYVVSKLNCIRSVFCCKGCSLLSIRDYWNHPLAKTTVNNLKTNAEASKCMNIKLIVSDNLT